MDISKLSGVLALWIGMVTNVIGPPSDDRGYRWSEWRTCTTACSSQNMRYRVCEKLNNGVSQCSPDATEESVSPSPANAPTTTVETSTTTEHPTTATSETITTTTTAEHPTTTIESTTERTTTEKQPTTITTETTTTTTTDIIETPTTALSTVYHSTTVQSEQNTSCGCECKKAVWTLGELNLTTEEANALIAELRQQLAVNVSQLSSTIRKKTSALDDRASSAAMGYLSGILLAFICFVIIGIDVFGLIIKLRM